VNGRADQQQTNAGSVTSDDGSQRLARLRKVAEGMGLDPAATEAALARSAAADAADAINTIDWRSWQGKTPPPRLWWQQDWLGPDATLFSGIGGIGKSLIVQTIGTALATGREFLGAAAKPLRVLAWMCEDDENELVRRQLAICKYFGIDLSMLEGRFFVVSRRGWNNTLLDLEYGRPLFTTEFLLLREQVNDLAIDVLVLDNIGQVFGGNENDRHQVTHFVNGCQGLVHERPFAPIFVGHVSRSLNSEFAGNLAWENACRMRWFISHRLPGEKPDRDNAEPAPTDPVYLCKRKVNYGAKDYRRLHYRDGLFIPESYQSGRRFDTHAREKIIEEILLDGLRKIGAIGLHSHNVPNSIYYLPKQLIHHKLNETYSTAELDDALTRLTVAGRLKIDVVGRTKNRKRREGLVEVVPGAVHAADEEIPF
jgi:RecA-family ATPase